MNITTKTMLATALATLDSSADFREANTMFNMAHRALQARARGQFHVGDAVKFTDKSGQVITGLVAAINPKNIKVNQFHHVPGELPTRWNVTPSLLTPAGAR
jgi:hypothetical protein